MSPVAIALAYLRQRPVQALLTVLLLALGIATVTVLLLAGRQAERSLARGAENVDFVVGAKGSPLQLILSAVYHLDAPTGNIPYALLDSLRAHRAVAEALPLALGDAYEGFRVVGTEPGYVALYGGAPAEGRLWEAPGEAVLGARVAAATGLGVGDAFVTTHGLGADDGFGYAHDDAPLRVVGVLAPGAGVLDALVLTSVETVWDVHGLGPPAPDEDHAHADGDADLGGASDDATGIETVPPPPPAAAMPPPPGGALPGDGRDLTAILVRVASPVATFLLPQQINAQTTAQAAIPAQEVQRLLRLLGVGFFALRLFGAVLIAVAALGVFAALTSALGARRHDLAVMRALGASRGRLAALVLTEGLLLTATGLALGLLLGHAATELIGQAAPSDGASVRLTGWAFAPAEVLLVLAVLAVGALAALGPAWRAYRTDVARTLAAP